MHDHRISIGPLKWFSFWFSGFYRWGFHSILTGGYGYGEGSPMASPMAVNDAMVMCSVDDVKVMCRGLI